jgi:hypothetical protein
MLKPVIFMANSLDSVSSLEVMYVYALRQVRIMTGEKVIGDMITVF